MREGCKDLGASKARGSGGAGKIPIGVGRHEGDVETDRHGPCGGDRGRKRPAQEGVNQKGKRLL
jgi:hypothetical protein